LEAPFARNFQSLFFCQYIVEKLFEVCWPIVLADNPLDKTSVKKDP